jgi:hypothetical protein
MIFPQHLFRFPVGLKFRPVGKRQLVFTIIGFRVVLTETSEIVRTYYRCSHEFCGQIVETDENDTTIARGEAPQ